jgi:hypothetical protein
VGEYLRVFPHVGFFLFLSAVVAEDDRFLIPLAIARVEMMIAIRKERVDGCRAYRPTPGDIRRACEEIQATWSPQERTKRARRMRVVCWKVPLIRLSDLDLVEPIDGERADLNDLS